MANEIDKTIEELEAEVIAELEEGNGADAPKKGATAAEPMKKKPTDGATGEEEIGGSTPDKVDPPKGQDAAGKEVSGDAQQKGEGKPDKMPKAKEAGKNAPLAASHVPEGEKEISEMGHEKNEMEMPKTKAEMQDKMIKAMKSMKKGEMENMYASYMNGKENMDKEESAEDKEKAEAVEKRVKDINVKEHVDALMNGEGDLSEEFKRKAATVFEAAVKSKVREEVERLEEDYRKDLDENMNKTQTELTEKVDNYLNYVVEEWTKENELAIERGLKGEIAEDFISGLKQLFEDHYIDVPDEKYDVLEAQSQKISELEAKLNEEVEKNIGFKNNNAKLVREQVISQCTGDLTEVEIEKFKSLTEDVDFTDEDSFRSKLDTLKESYFPKNKPVVTETTDDVETGNAQDIDTSGSMAVYMKAIGKGVKSAK
jgi:hypothetical protein